MMTISKAKMLVKKTSIARRVCPEERSAQEGEDEDRERMGRAIEGRGFGAPLP